MRDPLSPPSLNRPLADILDEYGIKDWDYLIIADGSGSTWKREAGWGAVTIERSTGARLEWFGCVNRGTVNVAEIWGILQPLTWLQSKAEDYKQAHGIRGKLWRVHIFTDSQYVADTLNNREGDTVNRNATLWRSFESMRRRGFELHGHWLRRNTIALHERADQLSKQARKLLVEYYNQLRIQGVDPLSVYTLNPAEEEVIDDPAGEQV